MSKTYSLDIGLFLWGSKNMQFYSICVTFNPINLVHLYRLLKRVQFAGCSLDLVIY